MNLKVGRNLILDFPFYPDIMMASEESNIDDPKPRNFTNTDKTLFRSIIVRHAESIEYVKSRKELTIVIANDFIKTERYIKDGAIPPSYDPKTKLFGMRNQSLVLFHLHRHIDYDEGITKDNMIKRVTIFKHLQLQTYKPFEYCSDHVYWRFNADLVEFDTREWYSLRSAWKDVLMTELTLYSNQFIEKYTENE